MFADHSVAFFVSVILCTAGVDLIVLFVWYIRCLDTRLTITNEQTTLRRGILRKFTTDMFHENVRQLYSVCLESAMWDFECRSGRHSKSKSIVSPTRSTSSRSSTTVGDDTHSGKPATMTCAINS